MFFCVRDYRSIPSAELWHAKRELPPRFSLGVEQPITLVIENHGTIASEVRVRDEAPDVFRLSGEIPAVTIPAAGQARLRYTARPLRRGAFSYGDVVLRSSGALGLVQKQIALRVADEVKVYPKFHQADQYQLLAKIDQRSEIVRKPRAMRAAGSDFESLRLYISGEDPRNIDWKATAKRGALVSRNKQVEKGQQLAVLLDAGRLMAGTVGAYSKLEHAMNAAVMLSYVVQSRGDALAVAAFSNRIESFLPSVRGPSLVPRVMESLYAVPARPVESDYWQVIAEIMHRLRRRSLLILMTDVLDAAASAGLINNLSRAAAHHLVLCVVLSEPRVRTLAESSPTTVEQTYQKAAACDLLQRRRLALEHMRARGILVLETDPDHLSIHLVQRYLEIRQANLQ
jgi:uncharacterized protein (DUF58 family)